MSIFHHVPSVSITKELTTFLSLKKELRICLMLAALFFEVPYISLPTVPFELSRIIHRLSHVDVITEQ